MEIQEFPHFHGRKLHLVYYKDVLNCVQLKQGIVSQETDIALINANVIIDSFQIYVAAARALHSESMKKLTTKSLHAELVFNLSGGRNVSEAFRRFGISDHSTNLILGVFSTKDTDIDIEKIMGTIQGTICPISDLGNDISSEQMAVLRKYYRIPETELTCTTILDAIICRIATKSCNK